MKTFFKLLWRSCRRQKKSDTYLEDLKRVKQMIEQEMLERPQHINRCELFVLEILVVLLKHE